MKIYVASSWRNTNQSHIVSILRNAGHEVSRANENFTVIFEAMQWADAFVLESHYAASDAHLRVGWAIGARKPTAIMLSVGEPQMMYGLADRIITSDEKLLAWAYGVARSLRAVRDTKPCLDCHCVSPEAGEVEEVTGWIEGLKESWPLWSVGLGIVALLIWGAW